MRGRVFLVLLLCFFAAISSSNASLYCTYGTQLSVSFLASLHRGGVSILQPTPVPAAVPSAVSVSVNSQSGDRNGSALLAHVDWPVRPVLFCLGSPNGVQQSSVNVQTYKGPDAQTANVAAS